MADIGRRQMARTSGRMAARSSKANDDFIKGLNEPLPFQRREWLVQRIGWVLMALVIVAGALGLFGDGPLAQRKAANSALQIEYDSLLHRNAQTTWVLTVRAPPREGRYRLALDASWARQFRIDDIEPRPQSTAPDGGRWIYEFRSQEGRATPILFHVEPRSIGRFEGSVQLEGAPPLAVTQFVYP
jgi:hypothetical protein